MVKRARIRGEHYTWRYIWSAATSLRDRGKVDVDDGWWLTMSAMLLCYSALEAYVNFLGPKLCEEEWRDEKAFFSKGEFRGTLGKLAYLMRRAGVPVQRGRQPWQTLKSLNERRDRLVHPLHESWDRVIDYPDTGLPGRVNPLFFTHADEAFVDKVMIALPAICDPLHVATGNMLKQSGSMGLAAFKGILGHQGGNLL